jgi:ABC-2 type transport system ATP-binding protein
MNNSIIQIKNLQRSFDGVTVLKGINAQVEPGQVVALLGKNGAGKTTLLETILGFAYPSFGEVTLWGLAATDIKDATKQRIGFVPQQDELMGNLTGREHVDLFAAFRPTWNQTLVDRLIADWLVPMDMPLNKMSVGQRQKLSILLALAHEPELLILDEPVASLDPIARRQFLQQLVEVAADEKRAVIFSTHIVSDVERLANQVWMLRDGELNYQGNLDQLKESVARISFSGTAEQLHNYSIPGVIRQRIQGQYLSACVQPWSAALQQQLERDFKQSLKVEYLSLEEIFVEINS